MEQWAFRTLYPMGTIRVSTVITATAAQVWAVVEAVEDHIEWMADAQMIRFTSPQRRGVGTTFECDTRVGPIRLTDAMEITEWEDRHAMGVIHTGLVDGSGRFTLLPAGPGRTEFRWEEELRFPMWMGGPLRDPVGTRLLEAIWRHNLKRLKALVESSI
jgi:hypothetical protein